MLFGKEDDLVFHYPASNGVDLAVIKLPTLQGKMLELKQSDFNCSFVYRSQRSFKTSSTSWRIKKIKRSRIFVISWHITMVIWQVNSRNHRNKTPCIRPVQASSRSTGKGKILQAPVLVMVLEARSAYSQPSTSSPPQV